MTSLDSDRRGTAPRSQDTFKSWPSQLEECVRADIGCVFPGELVRAQYSHLIYNYVARAERCLVTS